MSLLYRRRMLLQKNSGGEPPKTLGKTTLYTDGTFIINEYQEDRNSNIALHGAVTNEYDPLDENNPYVFANHLVRPWHNQRISIKSVYFGSPVNPTSTAYWFTDCFNVTLIDSNNLNTSNTTNMTSMFTMCQALTSLDVTNFDTSNVTNMQYMFQSCSKLTSLDVTNFDTSNVTNMQQMFQSCSALTSLDVTNFDTSKVTNTRNMFSGCSNLTSLDVTNFDTSKVTNMGAMFQDCSLLTSLDVNNFNTSNVTYMNDMFRNCQSLTTLDLTNFNTSKVTDMRNTFRDCSNLVTIYAGDNFATTQASYSSDMFNSCTSLVGGAGTLYSASYIDKTYARIDNPPTEPGYFTEKL